jgi:transposase
MTKCIWVGLDVHLDSITAAILEDDAREAEVVRLSGDLMQVRRLFRRLAKNGFVLHRVLARDGFSCDVIAPSLIPKKPGDRRKTDRLDAVMLAKLYRSGHLTMQRSSFDDEFARCQDAHRHDALVRDRRHPPLPFSASADGLPRSRSIGALIG